MDKLVVGHGRFDAFTFKESVVPLEGLTHRASDGKFYWSFEDGSEIEITLEDMRFMAMNKRSNVGSADDK